MKDLTIIVPLSTYDEEVAQYLNRAIESVAKADANGEADILFIGPKAVTDALKAVYTEKRYTFIENEDCAFSVNVNKAVKEVKTTYFTILEFDDTFSPNWFVNAEKYFTFYPELSVVLPLTEVVDFNERERGPIGYINEAVWASSFSDVIGYLDLECLKDYMNFNTTGAIFKKEDFIEVGGLKETIKLSFWYEFLLRALYNEKKLYVIPKVGYQHLINRPSSVSSTYNETMKHEEADFWIDLAQKEYIYKADRKKTYEE